MSLFHHLDRIQKEEYSIAVDLYNVLPDPGECNDPEEYCVWKGELTSNIEGALEETGYYIYKDEIRFDDDTKEKIRQRIKKDLEEYRKLKKIKK